MVEREGTEAWLRVVFFGREDEGGGDGSYCRFLFGFLVCGYD